MRGIRVVTRSKKETVDMCIKCYEKENEEIELALEFKLIQKPVVVNNIDKCQMCEEISEPSRD